MEQGRASGRGQGGGAGGDDVCRVHIECRDVRHDPYCGLRWSLVAHSGLEATAIWVHTLPSGAVLDLQSEWGLGTTGDPHVDAEVARWIGRRIAWHQTSAAMREAL